MIQDPNRLGRAQLVSKDSPARNTVDANYDISVWSWPSSYTELFSAPSKAAFSSCITESFQLDRWSLEVTSLAESHLPGGLPASLRPSSNAHLLIRPGSPLCNKVNALTRTSSSSATRFPILSWMRWWLDCPYSRFPRSKSRDHRKLPLLESFYLEGCMSRKRIWKTYANQLQHCDHQLYPLEIHRQPSPSRSDCRLYQYVANIV